MKTEMQLNRMILNLMMKIDAEFPELSKYIFEMQVNDTDTGNKNITNRNLHDYIELLGNLLKKYASTHISLKKRHTQTGEKN